MLNFINKSSTLVLIVPFALLMAEVLVKYPSNHGGGTVLHVALGGLATVINVVYMVCARRLTFIRIGILALFALLLYACDRYNVLITYEDWVERGMPEWGTPK